MSLRRVIVSLCAGLLSLLLLPAVAHAQRAALVQSVDEPARAPYQQSIIFNQGTTTCAPFFCTVTFPAVPAGKRLEITYASAIFGAPGGSATIVVGSDATSLGVYLPLPQTYGFNTYVGAAPLTYFVEPGSRPTVTLGGVNVNSASISAQAAIVGHLVSVP